MVFPLTKSSQEIGVNLLSVAGFECLYSKNRFFVDSEGVIQL